MLLHFGVDVVYYSGKCFVEVGYVFLLPLFLVAFVVSYFVLRIVLLAKVISLCYCTRNDARFGSTDYFLAYKTEANTPYEISSFGLCINKFCLSTWHTLFASLILLYVMHIYWFTVLLIMVKRIILDYREMGKLQKHE